MQKHLIYTLPFFVANKDASIQADKAIKIKQIEPAVEIVRSNISATNFIPVKTNTVAIPYLTYIKRFASFSKPKYICRNPKIANKLEVYTMTGLVVTENTAGTESMAKIISDNSTTTKATNNGVA